MTHLTSASIFYIELTYKTRKNPPKIFFSFDCTASFGCEPPDAAPCPASAARWWSPAAAGAFTKLGHLKIQREYVKINVLPRKNTYLCFIFINIYIFSIHYRKLFPHLRLAAFVLLPEDAELPARLVLLRQAPSGVVSRSSFRRLLSPSSSSL